MGRIKLKPEPVYVEYNFLNKKIKIPTTIMTVISLDNPANMIVSFAGKIKRIASKEITVSLTLESGPKLIAQDAAGLIVRFDDPTLDHLYLKAKELQPDAPYDKSIGLYNRILTRILEF
ncbi:hypothetical protein KY346_03510 [Candidatus Woesearchaeota archaeon]|nr:hypothetical protein [Candidatus Woesearchaeota archaeon]